MKAIIDAKIFDVDRDWLEIMEHRPELCNYIPRGLSVVESQPYKTHILKGKRYTTRFGNEVCLAVSDEIYELLEIPINAFEDMNDYISEQHTEINNLIKQNTDLRREATKHQTMNFWQKLKFLFSRN